MSAIEEPRKDLILYCAMESISGYVKYPVICKIRWILLAASIFILAFSRTQGQSFQNFKQNGRSGDGLFYEDILRHRGRTQESYRLHPATVAKALSEGRTLHSVGEIVAAKSPPISSINSLDREHADLTYPFFDTFPHFSLF